MHYKPVVLILCTGNSCRSQMAEGFLRHYAGTVTRSEVPGPSRPNAFIRWPFKSWPRSEST